MNNHKCGVFSNKTTGLPTEKYIEFYNTKYHKVKLLLCHGIFFVTFNFFQYTVVLTFTVVAMKVPF